jgi:hypothetical protein
MSIGVPSAMCGMSSTGTIFEITPLLPWRLAICRLLQAPLHGRVHLHHLLHAGRQLVAAGGFFFSFEGEIELHPRLVQAAL